MTGFKDGASSDDLFGSDDDTESDADATSPSGPEDAEPEQSSDSAQQLVQPETESESQDEDGSEESSATPTALPWIYARDDITDGRSKTVQLHLQESTLEMEEEKILDAKATLGESVAKADLREAALLVGLARTDDVYDVLREWGYDFQ